MYWHRQLGNTKFARSRILHILIDNGEVSLGGNQKNKVYGLLKCKSGIRMKVDNRVFFTNEQQAVALGYRPCGKCMPEQYTLWKACQK